jgi:hypothetical protein
VYIEFVHDPAAHPLPHVRVLSVSPGSRAALMAVLVHGAEAAVATVVVVVDVLVVVDAVVVAQTRTSMRVAANSCPSVSGPYTPSTARWEAAWKLRMACVVCGPMEPSIEPW